jgi:hypothetical protein
LGERHQRSADLLRRDNVAAAQSDVEIRQDDLARRAGIAAQGNNGEGHGRNSAD